MSSRYANEAIYNHLYHRVIDRNGPCVYCGIPAETDDHVPPLLIASMMSEKKKRKATFMLLPACGECNSTLGALPLLTVWERRAHVQTAYRKKYRKALDMPKWDEDELEELNPIFAEEVRRASARSEWVKARVTYRPHHAVDALSVFRD